MAHIADLDESAAVSDRTSAEMTQGTTTTRYSERNPSYPPGRYSQVGCGCIRPFFPTVTGHSAVRDGCDACVRWLPVRTYPP